MNAIMSLDGMPPDKKNDLLKIISIILENLGFNVGFVTKPLERLLDEYVKCHAKIINAKADLKVAFIKRQQHEVEKIWSDETISQNENARIVKVEKFNDQIPQDVECTIGYHQQSQLNFENIIISAGQKIVERVETNHDLFIKENLTTDWLRNLFDKCRLFSSAEMVDLWAEVLACEALKTGPRDGISRQTVNIMSMMSPVEINDFRHLLSFSIRLPNDTPVIFNYTDEFYNDAGIDFALINVLESLGLVKRGGSRPYFVSFNPKDKNDIFFFDTKNHEAKISYATKCFIIATDYHDFCKDGFEFGCIVLTRPGAELAKIIIKRNEPVVGFIEKLHQEFNKLTIITDIMSEPAVFPNPDGYIKRTLSKKLRLRSSCKKLRRRYS